MPTVFMAGLRRETDGYYFLTPRNRGSLPKGYAFLLHGDCLVAGGVSMTRTSSIYTADRELPHHQSSETPGKCVTQPPI